MNHNKPTIRRVSSAILLAGLAVIITGCKITINTSPNAEGNDPDSTGVQKTIEFHTAQAQNTTPETDSAAGDVAEQKTPGGLVIISPQIPSETPASGGVAANPQLAPTTSPLPTETLAPGAPSLTPKPQPQASATSPGGASLPQSKPSNTPAMGTIVTDTPSGMGFLSTETPFFGVLPSNTPGGMMVFPSSTPSGSMLVFPSDTPVSTSCSPPATPTNFRFNEWKGEYGNGLPHFLWDNSDPNLDGFRIYSIATNTYQELGNYGGGMWQKETNWQCNLAVDFYLVGYNQCGESGHSNTATVTGVCKPDPPSLAVSSAELSEGSTFIKYTFNIYAPANQSDVIAYYIYSSESNEPKYTQYAWRYWFTESMDCFDSTEDYYVTAVNYGGQSNPSNIITIPGQGCPTWVPSGSGG
jgi:hypothetical protein